MQAVRRQLPPPEGPCQASPSGRSQQPSPRQPSHTPHATSKTQPSTTPSKCIAPEQYVTADEIFKVSVSASCLASACCIFNASMHNTDAPTSSALTADPAVPPNSKPSHTRDTDNIWGSPVTHSLGFSSINAKMRSISFSFFLFHRQHACEALCEHCCTLPIQFVSGGRDQPMQTQHKSEVS